MSAEVQVSLQNFVTTALRSGVTELQETQLVDTAAEDDVSGYTSSLWWLPRHDQERTKIDM